MSTRSSLAFDRVVLVKATGPEELTVEEFQLLALPARVRYLLESRLQFFKGREPVTASVALDSMRHAAKSRGPAMP